MEKRMLDEVDLLNGYGSFQDINLCRQPLLTKKKKHEKKDKLISHACLSFIFNFIIFSLSKDRVLHKNTDISIRLALQKDFEFLPYSCFWVPLFISSLTYSFFKSQMKFI